MTLNNPLRLQNQTIKSFGLTNENLTKKVQIDTNIIHEPALIQNSYWLLKQPTILMLLATHQKSDTDPASFWEEFHNIL